MTLIDYLQQCSWKKLRAIQRELNVRVYGKRSKSYDLRSAIVYVVQQGFVKPTQVYSIVDA